MEETKKNKSEFSLLAICPLDGRYSKQVASLSEYFSEFALFKERVFVELKWLIYLNEHEIIPQMYKALNQTEIDTLYRIIDQFNVRECERIKELERTTNHDMKAVEYYLKEKLEENNLGKIKEFVHFTCTSEDINNLSYSLMLHKSLQMVYIPSLNKLLQDLKELISRTMSIGMMGRTHGQPASPTTIGKEIANFTMRIHSRGAWVREFRPNGKFNGAVGNLNAQSVAVPEVDWLKISEEFVGTLPGVRWEEFSTQIELHDSMVDLFSVLSHINTILIDFCRDMWGYISSGYFRMRVVPGEVGSSTMPHKVNPIQFENAEGNLGLSSALLTHFISKLPISRFQRDLSDSTVLRNIGLGIGYILCAFDSLGKGIGRLEADIETVEGELNGHYELLAEAVQTVMRKYGMDAPYEKLKEFTRGKVVTKEDYLQFVSTLELPEEEIELLVNLTPLNYIGYAPQLAQRAIDKITAL